MSDDIEDPAIQKTIADIDARAEARFAALHRQRTVEMVVDTVPGNRDARVNALYRLSEASFRLGYKAGVVDLGTELRVTHGAGLADLLALYEVVCSWHDSFEETRSIHEAELTRLISAIRSRAHSKAT